MVAPVRMKTVTPRLVVGVAIVACAFALANAAGAQRKRPAPTVKVIEFDKRPPEGKWQSLCPKLQLPADKSSIKIVDKGGEVVGSGHTGKTPSISKCKGATVVWRQTVNTIPTSLSSDDAGTFYAGMSRTKRGLAVDVGKFDSRGQPAWSAQVDGPADEGNAIIASGGGALYVFGASTGALAGQPANAKGYRFLAAYDSSTGKRKWLKQSRDFGKGSAESGSEGGSTPATAATDRSGNVYVLSSLDPNARVANGKDPVRLATLLKFDHKGKRLWRRTISVDLSSVEADSYRATLTAMTVDDEGHAIYLAGDALRDSHSELLMLRLDDQGEPRWTKLVSLSYGDRSETEDGGQMSISGDTGRVRGISVYSGDLLVVAEYRNSYIESHWEEDELPMEIRDSDRVAAVATLNPVDGELRWARLYSGLGPAYGSASEFQPTGLQILRAGGVGSIAVTGHDDIWVAESAQSFPAVPSVFLLMDARVDVYSEYPLNILELDFFQALQHAVKVGDKQWIADNVVYPMTVGPEFVIKNKAEFVKRYDSFITDRVRKEIAEEVGSQLWRQEPTWQRYGGLIGADHMLWMTEGKNIAIMSIGDSSAPLQAAAAAAIDPAEAQPKAGAEGKPAAAAEGKPAAGPQKSAKQLRREKMKKFLQELNKQASTTKKKTNTTAKKTNTTAKKTNTTAKKTNTTAKKTNTTKKKANPTKKKANPNKKKANTKKKK
jgi:hypothetical protein